MSSLTTLIKTGFQREIFDIADASPLKSRIEADSDAQTYTPLSDNGKVFDSEDEESQSLNYTRQNESKIWTTLLFKVLLAVFALWGVVNLGYTLTNLTTSQNTSSCYCGNSVTEAMSLGCKYVAMGSAWLPPHCRDEQLELEFENLGPNPDGSWNYYADENMTEILTSAQVASSGDGYAKYYTTWEWHVVHCLFYWRKVHRKQNNAQLVVETRFNQDKHIMHCAKLILGSKDGYTTSQIFLGDHEKDNSGEHVHWTDLHEA